MNRIMIALIALMILFGGCASEKQSAEPTPDLQAQIQSKMAMEKWLLDSRYLQHLCAMATETIQQVYRNTAVSDPRMAVAAVIDMYKKPGGLIESLSKILGRAKAEETRLEAVAEKDVRIFESLKRMNILNTEYIGLLSEIPESPEVFGENIERVDSQLSSIVKILLIEYPQSTDELNAKTSDDNMEFRVLKKVIGEIPTPAPVVETEAPAQEEPILEPTPTTLPIKTWRDKDGVMHMGYNAPEDAELVEIQSQLSGGVEISEAVPEEPVTESQKSMIWVDENGVTHMGQQVPEGKEAKSADEIPLMIGN